MLKEKSPEGRIKDIEYAFLRGYPIPFFPVKRKKKTNILLYVVPFILGTILTIGVFTLIPSKRQKIKQEKIIQKQQDESAEKGGCILHVPYDDEVVKIALELDVKYINVISEKKKKRNNLRPFIGDFKSFQDSVIVSSRLNSKSIPNKVEKVNGTWKVYIETDVPEIKNYYEKSELSAVDISSVEKILSQKFGEIVKVEVSSQEIPVAKVIIELSDEDICGKILNAFKAKGKSVERGIRIKS